MPAPCSLLRLSSAPGFSLSLSSLTSEGGKEVQPEGEVTALPARFPTAATLVLESEARLRSITASLALAVAA